MDYNFKHDRWNTATSAGAYASFAIFNVGAGASYSQNIYGEQRWNPWSWQVTSGIGVGTGRAGIGIYAGYGSSGWTYGMGGYDDPSAPSAFPNSETSSAKKSTDETVTACESCPPELETKDAAGSLATVAVVALVEPTFLGELALATYATYLTLVYGPQVVKDAVHYIQGKGERGRTAKPSGTNNPYKHLKPDPNKPGNVLQKDPHTGKTVSKPAPSGYIFPR